ncbi:MAG: hypothetical protein GYA24_16175, partial [Candidatus Lokiarchaeota archaeon]|nr:hypothetical protein [Candidatus Lokiarchaeota archaeon]
MPEDRKLPRGDPPRKATGAILRSSLPRIKLDGNIVKILPARLILRDAESIDR